MRCIFLSSTGLKSRFLASATGLSQNFADLIVAIHMYVRRFVGLMRMEVDAIWPHSQDRRHTLSISPFHEIEVAREARHNLGMHHLAKMCWVVSVFASKDNAELERLSSDEIRRSRWYHSKEILPLPTPPNGKYDVITDLRGHEDAFGTNR